MHRFSYHRPADLDEAAIALARAGTMPMGGGTDLLPCIEDGIAAPAMVVDLRAIPGFDDVALLDDGTLRIGAGARISDLAAHPLVGARFPALAQACDAVGTPALRNMGTIGGNLCQRPRCWYFRRGIACHKNGGATCPARDGENQLHAILDGGPCWIVHPSDTAVALTALDAAVEIHGPSGASVVPITGFFVLPRDHLERENVLRPGELVAAVRIPAGSEPSFQSYRKVMQRNAWDFALASVATARRTNGSVRIVLGGVSPRPWRVPESVEEDVASGGLDEDSIAALAERALYDAEPLSGNAYKVELAASLLRDAIRDLSRQ